MIVDELVYLMVYGYFFGKGFGVVGWIMCVMLGFYCLLVDVDVDVYVVFIVVGECVIEVEGG